MSRIKGVKTEKGIYYSNPTNPNFNAILNYYPKDLRYSITFLEAPGFNDLERVKIKELSVKDSVIFLILDPLHPVDRASTLKQAHEKAHAHIWNYLEKVSLNSTGQLRANVLDTTPQGRIYFEANRQLDIPFEY